MSKTKYGYCCITTFDWELGETTTEIYSSLESLKKNSPCADQCGIVKVKIKVEEVVQPGNWDDL